MKVVETRFTEKQLSRCFASALIASSVLLGAAVVFAQSQSPRSFGPQPRSLPRVAQVATPHPASPVAPPAITPRTDDAPAPRTAAEVDMDHAIAERVQQALATDHITRAQPIDIEVTRGITNLSGVVATSAVAQRALSIARFTGGVTAVQDAMKVEGEPTGKTAR